MIRALIIRIGFWGYTIIRTRSQNRIGNYLGPYTRDYGFGLLLLGARGLRAIIGVIWGFGFDAMELGSWARRPGRAQRARFA